MADAPRSSYRPASWEKYCPELRARVALTSRGVRSISSCRSTVESQDVTRKFLSRIVGEGLRDWGKVLCDNGSSFSQLDAKSVLSTEGNGLEASPLHPPLLNRILPPMNSMLDSSLGKSIVEA